MKRTTRIILIFVIIAALIVFAATLVHAVWYAPADNLQVPATTTTARLVPPEEQPARLIIPAIEVDAAVQYVGVTAQGAMGVPNNFSDVAWYKYGTVPGERGSAVIDGHVDNGLSLAGVFKRLGELKPGDDVYIERKNGERTHFRVEAMETYPYQEVPLERVFNKDTDAYLNLITCGGSWIKTAKTYDQRLVVYTRLVR